LTTTDYATGYSLVGTPARFKITAASPKSITIPKTNTQITLYFSDVTKVYYFSATSVDNDITDPASKESIHSNEVNIQSSTPTPPPSNVIPPPSNIIIK
jgi:hypothetical protein